MLFSQSDILNTLYKLIYKLSNILFNRKVIIIKIGVFLVIDIYF